MALTCAKAWSASLKLWVTIKMGVDMADYCREGSLAWQLDSPRLIRE
jgi:hypothetical protein